MNASDVHIELGYNFSRVRYRIRGSLQEGGPKLSKAACASAISMVKKLAGLKPERLRIPQVGRIEWEDANRTFLVSVAPCVGGESVTLRYLLRSALWRNLDELGIEADVVNTLRRWAGRKSGIIIFSGVVGSAKVTTFYALLQELNTPTVKIVSIEEPVSYRIDGINHIEVNSMQGVDYATALQCALAQDPDLIAIDSLKNEGTAELAFRAALRGNRILTVMHAADGPATVERLQCFGVKPQFITEALVGVVSQRLVRKICDKCKVPHTPTDARFSRGKGCDQCGGTGYRGWSAVFQLFELNEKFKALILQGVPTDVLREQARKSGVNSFRDVALVKAKAGITTLSEVLGLGQGVLQ